jgi:hypothetical protein
MPSVPQIPTSVTPDRGFVSGRDAIALVTLVAIWAAVLRDTFDPARSFALYMDNEFFIGTVLAAMTDTFAAGEWPLRMTTVLGGVPLYNLTQFSPFYPFYFAPLPLFETPLDAARTMHWITVLHVLLFAVNVFILLRVIGTSRLSAVTGGALVAFGTNSLAYAVWMHIVAPYAWLPLYLAGLIGVLENRPSRMYPAMAVVGMVLLALASPSQPLIHAVLLTVVLTLFRWWSNHTKQLPNATRISFFKLVAIAIIAFLISAPAVLPATLEFKDMIRWIGAYGAVTGFERIPFQAFLIDQLTLAQLGGVLVKVTPQAVGSQFAGPIVVALAIFALVSRSRSWIAIVMAMIAIYALLSSAGSNLGLAYVNYVLPLVNKIREPSRFLFLFQLAIGILAALGIDELRRIVSGAHPAPAWRRVVTLVVGIVLASVAAAFLLRGQGAMAAPALFASGLLLAVMTITVIAARTHWRMRGEAIALCWSAGALVVLGINVTWVPKPISVSHYLNNDGVALDMAMIRVAELDPRREYRLIFEGSVDKQMASMLASYRGIRTLNSYFNPAPSRQFQELYHHGPRTDNYLQILGARFLLCRDCAGTKFNGFNFLESIHGYDLHEATAALPYIQIAQRIDGQFESLADFIAKASSNDLSRGLLFVEKGGNVAFEEAITKVADCIFHEEIRKTNRMRYLVSCSSPGVLILNEFHANHWRVTVNGVASETLRVNGNQIGAQVGRGAQQVEFTYRPCTFLLSIALSLVGVVLALLWLLWPRRDGQR